MRQFTESEAGQFPALEKHIAARGRGSSGKVVSSCFFSCALFLV